MKKGKYIKSLEKFYFKRLKHVKKPTRRKRRIVAEHAFATAMFHLKNGVKTQYDNEIQIDRTRLSNDPGEPR